MVFFMCVCRFDTVEHEISKILRRKSCWMARKLFHGWCFLPWPFVYFQIEQSWACACNRYSWMKSLWIDWIEFYAVHKLHEEFVNSPIHTSWTLKLSKKTEHIRGGGGKRETRKMWKNGTKNATQKYKSIWNWYFKIHKEGFVCVYVSYSILWNCCDLERNNFQFVSDWTNFEIVFDLENDVGEVCTTHKLIVASVWGVFFFI